MYFQRDFNYWAFLLLITLLIEQNYYTDSKCIVVKKSHKTFVWASQIWKRASATEVLVGNQRQLD